jgi:release factor glutamine methyltransferase
VPTAAIATMPAEARDHEPLIALDGGADGLVLHRRIAAEARMWLADGGIVLIETGRYQAQYTERLLRAAGFAARTESDASRGSTVTIGVMQS